MPHIVDPSEQAITEAAEALAKGDVVALPTETVYGLAVDTANPAALRRVYDLKGRPMNNPLIAHVLDAADARSLVEGWNDRAESLAARFWPGPLTIILQKADHVPPEATAGLPTIAVRCPAHPVARAVLRTFGRPVSAPSANRSGHISPTRAEHVAADFADVPDLLILNGGPSACGIESTVLDSTSDPPRILRPGSIDADQIATALGMAVQTPTVDEQVSSPGTSPRHYAPRTPVELLPLSRVQERLRASDQPIVVVACSEISADPPHQVIAMPSEAERYAAEMYDALRRADARGASVIVIEEPSHADVRWRAIHNRLERAAYRPE